MKKLSLIGLMTFFLLTPVNAMPTDNEDYYMSERHASLPIRNVEYPSSGFHLLKSKASVCGFIIGMTTFLGYWSSLMLNRGSTVSPWMSSDIDLSSIYPGYEQNGVYYD